MDAIRQSHAQYVDLPGKRLAYNLKQFSSDFPGTKSNILVAFINGLRLPQASWEESIDMLELELRSDGYAPGRAITLFTYDRDGQGLSRSAEGALPKLHDINSAVQELQVMIEYVKKTHLSTFSDVKILLVAHSIGVPLARLYCQQHPRTITALLALDSNIANSDFLSMLPDPDARGFDEHRDLPPDTTTDQLRWSRENYMKLFGPTVSNPENLDRSNIADLLPDSDSPALVGPGGRRLILTIVAHDPVAFAEESTKISTKGLTERYVETLWISYNEGLLKIGDSRDSVVIAKGSGHFIQTDNPKCVAHEIIGLILRMNKLE